jgi:hypothetical protein
MHGIKDNVEIRVVGAPIAAGSSIDGNSTIIDMEGYESVAFVATITDSVDTGVAVLKIEESAANSDGAMTAVTGASATVTSASNDDINGTCLITEYRKTDKRYVQAVRTSATANIAYGSVVAILTPYRKPVTQHSTVSASAYVSN